jgi:hypothetical protein
MAVLASAADTFDKMDPVEMKKTWEMTRAMINCLDSE